MQIFLGILVISFAVWGVSDIFSGFRGDTITRVGKTDITASQFRQQYDMAVRQFGQQLGRHLTAQQAQQFGIPSQVLSQLVSQATLDDAARQLNLGISNEALAKEIIEDASFKGPSGTFDRNYFNQLLRANGYDEHRYVTDRRKIAVREQIGSALVGGTAVPAAYLDAYKEYSGEERSLAYLILPASVVGPIPEPTDAELTAYYDANKATWQAPEYRTISALRLTASDVAKPDEVSDEDARAAYDAAIASYTTKEMRRISQIVFADEADAQKAAASLAAGQTFDDLATERNLKPEDIDLGLVGREHFADPAVANAAFSLGAGTVSPVINGTFGPVMLRVETIQPEVVKTFDEVKADIKKDIAVRRAAEDVNNQHDMVEDERASGSTLAETAAKYGLQTTAIPAVDRNGNGEDGKALTGIPGGMDLVNAAFQSDVGIENDPIQIDDRSGYVWYDVTAITQARDRQLDEARGEVVAAWKKKQAADKVLAKANEVRDRLAKGGDIAAVATELGVEVNSADKVIRSTPASNDLPAAAVAAAFEGPKGTVTVSPGSEEGAQVVILVKDASVPAYAAEGQNLDDVGKQLGVQISNDVLSQYIAEMQNQLGVTINQAALQQILATQPEI